MPDNRGTARILAIATADQASVRVVTYNIHACVGVDRRYEPARIAAVLREIDADIVCLQEVDVRRGTRLHGDQAAYLAEATGHYTAGLWVAGVVALLGVGAWLVVVPAVRPVAWSRA